MIYPSIKALKKDHRAFKFQLGQDSSDNARKIRLTPIDGVDDQGYIPVILLAQDPSGNPVQVSCDAEGRILGGYEGDLTISMGDVEKLLAGVYWLNTKLEYDGSDNCIYKGQNDNLGAADGDTDWYITKFDWIGSNCTQIRVRKTSWTNKAVGW